ncbi:alpha/beta hydrolase [Mycobacteroides chelonae]|jgi:acetyl esterase/lipase|uniref:Hydrolase n=1 Tax=Mycobacteroides chelonae TaxID=1774 RepID=A0AB73N1A6_MYCCH|nr:alpha/beta hydrolase [Mycobacteroides chelonae]MBF9325378.1 alpha/beta hydrolase [Mycobacteroides chelonae]MBF9419554.1 alpha/beta hydrolase [Mycobacteroides chelonae]MBF9438036.1 alpha/beta hydrolase [Mycobacteroides chelonae]MBV6359338.1 alpha/beta hydrolase [Mycobacteroides chelonae]MEC4835068.1 alpha/beta hydrolase [Mycobacteroides chelonae]
MTANVVPLHPERLELTRSERGSLTVLLRLGRLAIRLFAYPVIALWARFPHLPWPYRVIDLAAIVLRPVRGVRRVRVRLTHCEAELMSAGGGSSHGAMLFLHGGAFVVGGLNTHRRLVSRIVTSAGVTSLAVNYRKLPGHSVSSAVEDALDGYRYLIDMGYQPSEIVIAGDSAGGFLALAASLIAQRRGLESPGALVCISPLVQRDPAGKLVLAAQSNDPLFPRAALIAMERLMMSGETATAGLRVLDSFVEGAAATLACLPPTLLQVGSDEILRPDAEFAAARLAEAGVPVELQIWRNQVHDFQIAADVLPDARAAVGEISAFVRAHVGRPAA